VFVWLLARGDANRRGEPTHQVEPGDGEESNKDDLIRRVNAGQ
jgi:hypothetical protein